MKLIGVDVDGTLIPLKGKRDTLIGIRDALHDEIVSGSQCILITSRSDAAGAQRDVWDQCGINLECLGTSRDWPAMKGEVLTRQPFSRRFTSIELWDDEPWYLNPAVALGVRARVVRKGQLFEFEQEPNHVPWVPKTPRPDVVVLPPV